MSYIVSNITYTIMYTINFFNSIYLYKIYLLFIYANKLNRIC